MTLQDQLIKYMHEHNNNNIEIARKTGVAPDQVSNIIKGKPSPMVNIKRLSDKLDPIFEQYVEYKTCDCGKKFIPTYQHRNYCSVECNKNYRAYVSSKPKAEKRSKPKQSIAEFMANGDYGERQREYLLGIQKGQRMEALKCHSTH